MDMKDELLLSSLEEAAAKLGVDLRYDDLHKGEVNTRGGIFKLRGQRRMIVHKGLSVRERVEVITELLSTMDIEGVHLPPEVRERIESAKSPRAEAV